MNNLWQHSRVWLIALVTCVWLLSWRVLYWFHSFHRIHSWPVEMTTLVFVSSHELLTQQFLLCCVRGFFCSFRFISFIYQFLFHRFHTTSYVCLLRRLWVTAIMVYLPSICSTMISCSSAFVLRGLNFFCFSVFSALWEIVSDAVVFSLFKTWTSAQCCSI